MLNLDWQGSHIPVFNTKRKICLLRSICRLRIKRKGEIYCISKSGSYIALKYLVNAFPACYLQSKDFDIAVIPFLKKLRNFHLERQELFLQNKFQTI